VVVVAELGEELAPRRQLHDQIDLVPLAAASSLKI
jgi:hypothetical protein